MVCELLGPIPILKMSKQEMDSLVVAAWWGNEGRTVAILIVVITAPIGLEHALARPGGRSRMVRERAAS
jgi:hypothetical protein